MKKILKRLLVIMIVSITTISTLSPREVEAISLPSIYSISGTVFLDTNQNGVMELHKLDLPVSKTKVELFTSLEDAQNGSNAIKSVETNSVGIYNFSNLQRGTYFIKYGTGDTDIEALLQKNSAVDAENKQIAGIVKVDVNTLNLASWVDLAVKKTTNLTVSVFNDTNGNGVMDENESIANGKSMIFINLEKILRVIDSGELASLDITSHILGALGGSIDLFDAIHIRTTEDGRPITLPDVDQGIYVILRSPFNLTIGDILGNPQKIISVINMITNGDISDILDNSELLNTGDINTTPNNEYIKKIAEFLPKAIRAVEKLNVIKFLETSIDNSLEDVRAISNLLNNIPDMQFVKVDIWGNSYNLSGLRVIKTSEFSFGIRPFVSIVGQVYGDSNNNGIKDTLELSRAVTLTAYDENGNILNTINTPSTIGSYKLDMLPYDTTIYVGISGTEPYTSRFNGTIPPALKDVRIVDTFHLSSDDVFSEATLNIGISSLSDIGVQLTRIDNEQKSAVITVTNRNTTSLTIEYTLNDGTVATTEINGRSLLGSDVRKDIILNDLSIGENIVRLRWMTNVYTGSYKEVPIVISE